MKLFFAVLVLLFCATGGVFAEEALTFDFEEDIGGWNVPLWTMDDNFYFTGETSLSDEVARSGDRSLAVYCEFPGDQWTAVLVERPIDADLSRYETMSAWVYLPKDAGGFYQARIVMTVGRWWVETKYSVQLKQGSWTRVVAPLALAKDKQLAVWECRGEEMCIVGNLDRVKAIGIRLEYNASPWQAGPEYKGPIYIDDIELR